MARAIILAVEVFPVPLEPQNKYAWAIRPVIIWLRRVAIHRLLAYHGAKGLRPPLAV